MCERNSLMEYKMASNYPESKIRTSVMEIDNDNFMNFKNFVSLLSNLEKLLLK